MLPSHFKFRIWAITQFYKQISNIITSDISSFGTIQTKSLESVKQNNYVDKKVKGSTFDLTEKKSITCLYYPLEREEGNMLMGSTTSFKSTDFCLLFNGNQNNINL